MKKKLGYVVITILSLSQIYSIYEINNLKSQVKETSNGISHVEDRLGKRINEIYLNVDNQMEEHTSLIASGSHEIGKLDVNTLKIPITFKLQPKTLSDSTKVFLKFNDEKIQMERKDIEFILSKEFEIMDSVFPTIILEEDGVLQIEENGYLRVSNIKDQIFSSISPRFIGRTSFGGQEDYKVTMNGEVSTGSSTINSDNLFKEIKYIVMLDENIIKTYDADFIGMGNIDINHEFKLKKGQKLTTKLIAIDSLGFTHEYLMLEYIAGEVDESKEYYENAKIIAPNGIIVYEMEESKLN